MSVAVSVGSTRHRVRSSRKSGHGRDQSRLEGGPITAWKAKQLLIDVFFCGKCQVRCPEVKFARRGRTVSFFYESWVVPVGVGSALADILGAEFSQIMHFVLERGWEVYVIKSFFWI